MLIWVNKAVTHGLKKKKNVKGLIAFPNNFLQQWIYFHIFSFIFSLSYLFFCISFIPTFFLLIHLSSSAFLNWILPQQTLDYVEVGAHGDVILRDRDSGGVLLRLRMPHPNLRNVTQEHELAKDQVTYSSYFPNTVSHPHSSPSLTFSHVKSEPGATGEQQKQSRLLARINLFSCLIIYCKPSTRDR